jgi:hypothetical protein
MVWLVMSYFELGKTFQSPIYANLLKEAMQGTTQEGTQPLSASAMARQKMLTNRSFTPSKDTVIKDDSNVNKELGVNVGRQGDAILSEENLADYIAEYEALGGSIGDDYAGGDFADETWNKDASKEDKRRFKYLRNFLKAEYEKNPFISDDFTFDESAVDDANLYLPEVVGYDKAYQVGEDSVIVTEENQAALAEFFGTPIDKLPIGKDVTHTWRTSYDKAKADTTKDLFGQEATWVGDEQYLENLAQATDRDRTDKYGVVETRARHEPKNTVWDPIKNRYVDVEINPDAAWAYMPPEDLVDWEDAPINIEELGQGPAVGTSPLGTIFQGGIYTHGQSGNLPVYLTGDPEKDKEIAESLEWMTKEASEAGRKFIPWDQLEGHITELYGEDAYQGILDAAVAARSNKYTKPGSLEWETEDLVDIEDLLYAGQHSIEGLDNYVQYSGESYEDVFGKRRSDYETSVEKGGATYSYDDDSIISDRLFNPYSQIGGGLGEAVSVDMPASILRSVYSDYTNQYQNYLKQLDRKVQDYYKQY